MESEPKVSRRNKDQARRRQQGIDALHSRGFAFEAREAACLLRPPDRPWVDYYPHTGRWRAVGPGSHAEGKVHEGGVAKFAKWWAQFDLDHKALGFCPYCGDTIIVTFEKVVYGRAVSDRGLVIACSRYPVCDSYTGWSPMGLYYGVPVVLADKQTRKARVEAHEWFDRLWRAPTPLMSRKAAYARLAERFDLPPEQAHIKLFNYDQCQRLIVMVRKRLEIDSK